MPTVGGGGTNYTYWDLGSCNCPCDQPFVVKGCGNQPYPGVLVSVYDHSGGTLLASGTTDSAGLVSLAWSGPGSVYVTVTGQSARFNAFGATYTPNCAGIDIVLALTPATGYACFATCLLPVSTTWHATVSGGCGSQTATVAYSGGSGMSWTYVIGVITYVLDVSNLGGATVWTVPIGPNCYGSTGTVSITCPTPFSVSFGFSFPVPCVPVACSGTFTATE